MIVRAVSSSRVGGFWSPTLSPRAGERMGTRLTGNHTIFGELVEGQDVVDKITKLPRSRQDKPNKDVVLNSVTIERV